jgi:putative ABC transport system permease protein
VFGNSNDFFVSRRPLPPGASPPVAEALAVDGSYFAALGIPLRAGRVFDARDTPDAPAAVIVSASLARQYFPGEDPVGQQLNLGGPGPENAATIVGVVGDVRYAGVARPTTVALYQPFAQAPGSFSVVVRARRAPGEVAAALGTAVRRLDPELAVARVRTMRDLVDASVAADRFRATLLGLFALAALGLAAVGIYGVLAYAVGRRARELGIRRALGAGTRQVYALVLREGLAVAAAGTAAGLALALALTCALAGLLYEVSAVDALTFGAVPALLLAVAAAACVVPARRAARVDPAAALRAD